MLATAVLCTLYPGIDALGYSLPDDLSVSEICHLVWGKKMHIFHLSGKLSQLQLLFHFNNPVNKSLLETASWHLGHQGCLGGQHGPVAWSLLPLEGWGSAIPSYGSINTALLRVSTEIAMIEAKMRQMASLSSCQRDFLMLFALHCQPEAFAIVKACNRFSGSVFLHY